MSAPRVSVLMSVFNTQPYVGAAIESVLAQTCTDLQLIVVDDCSTDESWSVVSSYIARDPRITAVRTERNLGASGALNLALASATGTYLTRQDSDDLSAPTRLEAQIGFLEANPGVEAVGVCPEFIDADGRSMRTATLPLVDEDIQPAIVDYMCFCGPTLLFSRSAFERAGAYFADDLAGSEDYDLALRLAEVTRLANMDAPLYRYRQHATSVSHQRRPQQLFRKALALDRAINRRFGPHPAAEHFQLVARDYFRAAVVGYSNGDMDWTSQCLERALSRNPGLLKDEETVERVVRSYTPRESADAALRFTTGIFGLLPSSHRLDLLRSRLVSEIHMHEVFAAIARNQREQVRQHLWPAIRSNWGWLRNPGVLSLLLKQAVGSKGSLAP